MQRLLEEYNGSDPPPESLQRLLIDELNRLLEGSGLFDEQRFAQVRLTDETRRLIAQNPTRENLIRLNRLLLEEAYPHEIAKSLSFRTVEGWSGLEEGRVCETVLVDGVTNRVNADLPQNDRPDAKG